MLERSSFFICLISLLYICQCNDSKKTDNNHLVEKQLPNKRKPNKRNAGIVRSIGKRLGQRVIGEVKQNSSSDQDEGSNPQNKEYNFNNLENNHENFHGVYNYPNFYNNDQNNIIAPYRYNPYNEGAYYQHGDYLHRRHLNKCHITNLDELRNRNHQNSLPDMGNYNYRYDD